MNNTVIKILLLLLFLALMAVVAWEIISKRPDRSSGNPWEYNVDEFMKTGDTSLIKYNEILNIQLDSAEYKGISYSAGKIYIAGNNFLQVISPQGKELYHKELMNPPFAMTVSGDMIFIAFSDRIFSYSTDGDEIHNWEIYGENVLVTSLKAFEDLLFVADAANRRVLRYKTDGEFLGYFEGKSEADQLHGFIVPSGYFDLDISEDGELWVVNPGKHSLEHYSHQGKMLRSWGKASFTYEGFSGCCNPAQMAILPDGSFVTSEKNIVRIKVHKAFGDVYGYVAPPEKFENATYAPDITVTPEGIIYALDFNTNKIRVFQHK